MAGTPMVSDAACCDALEYHRTLTCPQHTDPFECPDVVITRLSNGSHGLPIHDGGASFIEIEYCPWCGTPLA